jgi:hypothetical protein
VYSQNRQQNADLDAPRVQLHGSNASYAFLLRVRAVAYEALLPEPGTGCFRFREVLADPQAMGLIFHFSRELDLEFCDGLEIVRRRPVGICALNCTIFGGNTCFYLRKGRFLFPFR